MVTLVRTVTKEVIPVKQALNQYFALRSQADTAVGLRPDAARSSSLSATAQQVPGSELPDTSDDPDSYDSVW